jgi:hypothetical protein
MILSSNVTSLHGLRLHATAADYFEPMSDSHYVAEVLPNINGEPAMALNPLLAVALQLGAAFTGRTAKQHNCSKKEEQLPLI